MKPKEALPRRYDAELHAALKMWMVRRIFTGGNEVVWPERYHQVGYYYEVEKDVFKLKPRKRSVTSTLEQMFQDEALPTVGGKKQWMEVDDDRKGEVPGQATVDATKDTEEKEEAEKSSWADVEDDTPL